MDWRLAAGRPRGSYAWYRVYDPAYDPAQITSSYARAAVAPVSPDLCVAFVCVRANKNRCVCRCVSAFVGPADTTRPDSADTDTDTATATAAAGAAELIHCAKLSARQSLWPPRPPRFDSGGRSCRTFRVLMPMPMPRGRVQVQVRAALTITMAERDPFRPMCLCVCIIGSFVRAGRATTTNNENLGSIRESESVGNNNGHCALMSVLTNTQPAAAGPSCTRGVRAQRCGLFCACRLPCNRTAPLPLTSSAQHHRRSPRGRPWRVCLWRGHPAC